jgi:tetratricopeptide (TPR) repeat protein
MIERDYIMRMIAMLTAVIKKIFALKEAREYPQALEELQRASQSLLGLDPEILSSFDASSLAHLFGSDPHAASTKCYAAGVLLNERADLLVLLNRPDEALADRAQSLSLLLEAYQIADDPIDARHTELIDEIADSFPLMPDALEERLLAYREQAHARITPPEDQ